MEKKLLLIMNPTAGMRRANRFLVKILDIFERAGYIPTVLITRKRGDGREFAKQFGRNAELVVVIGGDGTLNEVIDGLLLGGAETPVGYIPAGSTNDFAASLGLSHDIIQAALDAVGGKPRTLDVCAFNGRNFTYVASCGAFTNLPYTTPQSAKNLLGHAAYVLDGIRDLPQIRPIRMKITTDADEVIEGDYLFAAFSNSTSIAGVLTLDEAVVSMNDGRFEILLVENPPAGVQELGQIIYCLMTQQYNAKNLVFRTASRVTVELEESVDWTLDGEFARGCSRIEIANVPGAIRVMAPPKRRMLGE